MRSRAVKVGLQAIFESHSSAVYHSMAARVRKRYKIELPFTLPEFRAWSLERLGGSWDMAVQCCYCTRWLNAQTFVPDHVEPLRFGGAFGLQNLDLCCEECNRIKGSLSAMGFRKLVEFAITELHPQDSNEIFGRMKDGSAYVGLRIRSRMVADRRGRRNITEGLQRPQTSC